jgi:hypothetical protein
MIARDSTTAWLTSAGRAAQKRRAPREARARRPARYTTVLAGIAVALLASLPARAQDSVRPAESPQAPVPGPALDQAVEDVSPLSVSLRVVDPGLRQPAAFDQVYQVPGSPRRLMRMDGGLAAVFGRSVYVRDRRGRMQPVVPNDTVFLIAPLPAPDPRAVDYPLRLDARLPGRFTSGRDSPQRDGSGPDLAEATRTCLRGRGPAAAAPRPEALLAPIVRDEPYRARRLRDLMRRAAEAHLGSDPAAITPRAADRRRRRRSDRGTPGIAPGLPSCG